MIRLATVAPSPEPTTGALGDILALYLLNSPAYRWPGADGLLVGEVLREYPTAVATGAVPGEIELCGRHPGLTAQIVAFFFLQTVECDHV